MSPTAARQVALITRGTGVLIGLQPRPASVAGLGALLVVALGALVLAGWVFGVPALLTIRPAFPPMMYTTALAFIASGGALLLVESGHRRSAVALALLACSLAIAALVWPEPGLNPTLHRWLSERLFVAPTAIAGPMSEPAALGFLLFAAGVALLTLPRATWARLSARLLGVGVAAIGSVGVFGVLSGMAPGSHDLAGLSGLAVHTAAGLIAIGAGLVVLSTRQLTTLDVGGPRWLPAMVGLVSLVLTFGFWQLSLREVARLSAQPAPAATGEASRLPAVALGLGLALTVVLMMAVSAAQRATRRSRLFEEANRRLIEEGAELQRAQGELAALADELHRSNRELEDFAAIASHDLRSPLAKLRGFTDILREDYASALDAEGRDILDRLVAIVARMQTLVDDLLTLARVTARAKPFEPVDLTSVARVVVGDLEPVIAAASGEVTIGPLPEIDADPTQMHQLLQNLVANGLKFRRPGVAPVVRIASTVDEAAGEIEVRVTDNGIGFDPKFAEQIFRPFERLHAAQAYEGSGIGLAVCSRIVSRHGGKIRAEGRPGEGATFIVRLPPSQRERAGEPETRRG